MNRYYSYEKFKVESSTGILNVIRIILYYSLFMCSMFNNVNFLKCLNGETENLRRKS